jgi:hypothetical protein
MESRRLSKFDFMQRAWYTIYRGPIIRLNLYVASYTIKFYFLFTKFDFRCALWPGTFYYHSPHFTITHYFLYPFTTTYLQKTLIGVSVFTSPYLLPSVLIRCTVFVTSFRGIYPLGYFPIGISLPTPTSLEVCGCPRFEPYPYRGKVSPLLPCGLRPWAAQKCLVWVALVGFTLSPLNYKIDYTPLHYTFRCALLLTKLYNFGDSNFWKNFGHKEKEPAHKTSSF